METGGDDPDAIRSRGRIRLQIPLAYRSPPDPNARARGGSTFLGPFTAGEVMDPSGESPPGEPTEQEECFDDDDAADSSSSSWAWADNDSFQLARAGELRRPGAESDYPGAPRTRSGTRSRQHPRATRHPEHPGEMSSSEPEVTNLQSASPSAGAQVDDITGIRIRQSALYSNRPRRPRRRHASLLTQDHPSEVSSSDLAGAVADLPTLESLSPSEPPPLTPPISGEVTGDDDDDHPGAERTGSRTRVRQSVLYSDRPRQSRHRRPTEHVEHPSEVESSDLEVTNLPAFEGLEAPSVIDSSTAFPSETKEYPSEASIGELGRAVTDLPTLETLSLRESPLLTPQMTVEESEDEDDESSHIYMPRDSSIPNGLRRSVPLSDSLLTTVSMEELRRPDSDEDSEETRHQIQQILDALSPCNSIKEFFDRLLVAQHAALTALAIEHGTELPGDPFLVDEESQLAPQHAPAAAAQPLATATTSNKASTEENNEDGKKWMRDEVKLCFQKHIEKTAHRMGLDYELDELCHQCFSVESYTKIFHHYNFKMRTKMPSSLEWTVELYFAEVKEIFGRKLYFCCPLEPNESGNCYACKNQGVEELRHPATGGFEVGLPDAPKSSFWWCSDEDE